MKKLTVFAVAAFACLCFIGFMSGEVFADGTDELGDPIDITIKPGSGIVAAGIGMVFSANTSRGGDIRVFVPYGADIKQVLLYWEGRHADGEVGDKMSVDVLARLPEPEGNVNFTSVIGDRIGEPFIWYKPSSYTSAYRADVTTLGLVEPGHSRFSVKKGSDVTEGSTFSSYNVSGTIFQAVRVGLSRQFKI